MVAVESSNLPVHQPQHADLPVVVEWTRERIDLVKKTVVPQGISDGEFALFMEQCRRTGLDPLIKQCFCVPRNKKVKKNGAESWVTVHEFQAAEAGMLARAEDFPDYLGTTAAAVYDKDHCAMEPGVGRVDHQYDPTKPRGNLLGAWAKIERRGRTPLVKWLNLKDYAQDGPMWSGKAATMIEKCAKVAGLRQAFPKQFGGIYIPEEMDNDAPPARAEPAIRTVPALEAPKAEAAKFTGEIYDDIRKDAEACADLATLNNLKRRLNAECPDGSQFRAGMIAICKEREAQLALTKGH